jgi:hypothetical protein
MLVGLPDEGAGLRPTAGALETVLSEGDGEGLADARKLLDEIRAGEATAPEGAVATGEAFRLPACLPTKNAPTQIPMTQANPSIDSVRLLAGVIELI